MNRRILALLAPLALSGCGYNRIQTLDETASSAKQQIEVQLQRRADLVPNLVNTVKGYAAHEKETLENVVDLRNRAQAVPAGDVAGRAQAEGMLSQALGRIFALAEAYPDLKANQNFAELQQTLETLEGEIQMSRRYYNGAVRNLNTMIESFPTNIIANQFAFTKAEFFEIGDAAAREVPKVDFKTR